MSQKTTTQDILKMAFVALMIQAISFVAHAAGSCVADKSDIRDDMQKIAEKLAVKYGKSPTEGFKKANFSKDDIKKIYDTQELKVDRSFPFLNQVNAVGVVTDSPLGTQKGYASAVLISPCHVLINAHAITKDDARQGKNPVYVSVGQNTCESKNEFLHQDMPGKVIALGDASANPKDINPAKDYAIVRIRNVSDIKPAVIAVEFIGLHDSLMVVGFPHRSTYSQKTGLRYPTANFVRINDVGTDGSFTTTNRLPRPGGSGSGIFVLDENNAQPRVIMAGIHQGEGGQGIQTASILQDLKISNPSAFEELKSAVKSKACN